MPVQILSHACMYLFIALLLRAIKICHKLVEIQLIVLLLFCYVYLPIYRPIYLRSRKLMRLAISFIRYFTYDIITVTVILIYSYQMKRFLQY